ncbi:MAG: caspase family protein [Rhodospirillaceae bacterium]
MTIARSGGLPGVVLRTALLLSVLITGAAAAAPDSIPAAPGEPPTAPFLRIETGMHGAIINRVSVDAAGRLAATASDDKTVRLWSLPEGKPAGTIRVPIGPGMEGSLYSVALSPDGRTLATAGAVGQLWDGRPSLYLFDVATRKVKARLPGLPSEILHLAFSPDGKRLAAAFGGGYGLMVYELATGRTVGEDHEYGRLPANWVAFDATGRLATTGFDGFVRLYDNAVKLITKVKSTASGRPFSVAFSPDGGLLAVGSFDKPKVDILSGTDLKPRFSPDTADLKTGNLAAVAWLADDKQISLAAGGTASKTSGERLIRVWGSAGMGRALDIVAAKDAINQIEPTGHGEALFVSADPSWGRINAGRKLFEQGANLADFRDIYAGRFAVSDDALTLEFGTANRGLRPMRLALANQSYEPARHPDPALASPITESPGIKVTGWQNTPAPMVGTRKLRLDGEERARSLAIAPDGRSFLLGADYSLRLYDAKGNPLAKTDVPAMVAGVVINRPGTMAVAALTDGTLHWFSLGGNRPLLEERATVFVHADGQRWVAWTPEGFFEHAENGGKDLVGYHFNKGKQKAPEFVNFAQVYPVFHSSELLIKKITGGYDDEISRTYAAIGDLRARFEQHPLPGIDLTEYCWTPPGGVETCRPISDITTRGFARDASRQAGAAPATLSNDVGEVTLKFEVTDRGGGVGDIALVLNGRSINRDDVTRAFRRDTAVAAGPVPAPASAGPAPQRPDMQRFARRIALEPGANILEIHVYDGARTAFAASPKVEVTRAAPLASSRDLKSEPLPKPRLFVLAAGINQYKSPQFRLRFPVADAEGVVAAIRARVGDLYRAVMVPTLTPTGEVVFTNTKDPKAVLADDNANLTTLEKAFTTLSKEGVLEPNDTVVIYLAGHGVRADGADAKGQAAGNFYFITSNVDSPETVERQALSQNALLSHLIAINNRKARVLLVLDTCHSGSFAKGAPLDAIANLKDDAGILVLAAAASDQEALDGYRPGGTGVAEHGVFAHAMIQGMNGAATADENGVIYPNNLAKYVKKAVGELAAEVNPRHQQQAKWQALGELDEPPLVRKTR